VDIVQEVLIIIYQYFVHLIEKNDFCVYKNNLLYIKQENWKVEL
jgi:hypothetical protein